MNINSSIARIALLALAFTFGFGWWAPNYFAWNDCGATQPLAVSRAFFQYPTLPACLNLELENAP